MGIEHALPPGDRDESDDEELRAARADAESIVARWRKRHEDINATGPKVAREGAKPEGKDCPASSRLRTGARKIESECGHRLWWKCASIPRARKRAWNSEEYRRWIGLIDYYEKLRNKYAEETMGFDPLKEVIEKNADFAYKISELSRCGIALPITPGEEFLIDGDSCEVWIGDSRILPSVEQQGLRVMYDDELREFATIPIVEKVERVALWHGFWAVRKTLGPGGPPPVEARSGRLLSTRNNLRGVSSS